MVIALAIAVATLEAGFFDPPREARPETWYHWMNGNVTKSGITADLEAISAAGLGAVHIFDAGCEIPPGPVAFNTPAWNEHIRYAVAEAKRLGLGVVIPNCSGWSSSGGPWVAPSNSMKVVTHTSTAVKGGERFVGRLPQPQDKYGFYEDIAVMAIPEVGKEVVLGGATGRVGGEGAAATGVRVGGATGFDGVICSGGALAAEFTLERKFEATSLEVAIEPNGWIGQHRAFVTVEISDDGRNWRKGDELVLPMAIDSIVVTTAQRLPFERPLTSRYWRLTFAPQNLPANITKCKVSGLKLLNRAVIPGLEGKTFALRDQRPYPTHKSLGAAVPKDAIIDLTGRMKADGELDWTAPSGRDWRILRIGYASNGRKNHPASRFGCGFEVDKLSRTALDYHFESYVGKLCRELGDLAGHGDTGLIGTLVDSYEIGCQNWTQGFAEEFHRRAGYRIEPYLPVLAGFVIGGADESERFLDDYRRVIAALFCENYPGALRRKCHEYGLKFYLEPYGNCPADDLEYGYYCDVPMSEFWVGEKENRGTGVTRMVASMAHVYGKRIIGSESFTAAPSKWGGKWQSDLYSLKTQGDLAYCEGVNRVIYHRFTHQPLGDRYLPGMTMGHWGTHFDRTNTWWPYVGELIRYQSRCQYLLQQGQFVADAAVFLGEQMPSTLTPYDDRIVPEGFNCDVINLRGLKSLRVEGGEMVTPGGMRYPLLVLPDAPLRRDETLAEVQRLKAAGAKVCRRAEMSSHLPAKDFDYEGSADLVRYIHRRYSGSDGMFGGYFVAYANRTNAAILRLSFRIAKGTPEFWHPDTGKIEQVREWSRTEGGRTEVVWNAAPGDSVFVMFRDGDGVFGGALAAATKGYADDISSVRLTLPGGTSTNLSAFVSWTRLADEFRYFSGTATYDFTFTATAKPGAHTVLDLGAVRNIAEVTVNGRAYPVLWKPPFRLDITDALAADIPVRISVKVTNLWPNRLIGDDFKPEDCEWKSPRGGIREIPAWVREGRPSPAGRTTFTTWKHWTKDDAPLESGILGPVCMITTIMEAIK